MIRKLKALMGISGRRKPRRTIGGLRSYNAAQFGRLSADWQASQTTANREIEVSIATLRNRARDLERNNDYVRRFLKMVESNILGSSGIVLRAKSQFPDGSLDTVANQIIEQSWKLWSKTRYCSKTRRHTWHEIQRLILRSCARDGQAFVLGMREEYEVNPFGYSLRMLESDHLADTINRKTPEGNWIRNGIEHDSEDNIVAYHLYNAHPGDRLANYTPNPGNVTRWDARQVFHVILPDRIAQTLGAPWIASSMDGLRMLGGYMEAEVVAARVAASKMGFFTKTTPDGYQGEKIGNDRVMDAQPGGMEELPVGVDFKPWTPDHPTQAFGDFVKATLRGISGGLNVSYNSLANDLEGVNYSSIRAGLIDERDSWIFLQQWFTDVLCMPVYLNWLRWWLFNQATPLPATRYLKFTNVKWQGRRWAWVDPQKDIQASIDAVKNGFKSRRQIIAESGDDINEVFAEQEEDEQLAESHGLNFDES